MNLADFPPLIRTRRESLGWTQVQLAAAAKTQGNTVARIERGERLPRWDLAVALIDAMGGLSVRGWSPVGAGRAVDAASCPISNQPGEMTARTAKLLDPAHTA